MGIYVHNINKRLVASSMSHCGRDKLNMSDVENAQISPRQQNGR